MEDGMCPSLVLSLPKPLPLLCLMELSEYSLKQLRNKYITLVYLTEEKAKGIEFPL
jgi:hypothetical protein